MEVTVPKDELARLTKLLHESFPAIAALTPDNRRGAVVAVRVDAPGGPIECIALGDFPEPAKKEWSTQLAYEKIMRLSVETDDLSSFETRNPSNDLWAGAIRSHPKRFLLSCSGLPELLDEAYMLAVAVKLGWCSPIRAKRIMQKSQNEYYALAWVAVGNGSQS